MKNIAVTANFTCDVCHTTTATTAGRCPSNWKEISQVISAGSLSPIKKRVYVCPTCAASTDSAILTIIRDLALRAC